VDPRLLSLLPLRALLPPAARMPSNPCRSFTLYPLPFFSVLFPRPLTIDFGAAEHPKRGGSKASGDTAKRCAGPSGRDREAMAPRSGVRGPQGGTDKR